MTADGLTQHDLEDLSALLDGELPAARARELRERIRADGRWQAAWEELTATDRALDAWRVPQPAADLPERIIRGTRKLYPPQPVYPPARGRTRQPPVVRFIRWAGVATAAAAAAAAIAFTVAHLVRPSETTEPTEQTPVVVEPESGQGRDDPLRQVAAVPEPDRPAVMMLGMFHDLDVLENLETLQAVERLDRGKTGT
jgi:anti-sigma-K factor RskA